MTDPQTARDASDRAPEAASGVRQVPGALGSSQGSAGAAEADPVLMPGADHQPAPEGDEPGDWVSDKSPAEQAQRKAEGLPRQAGEGDQAERNDRGSSQRG
jgi:hypothetical protein